MLLRFSVFTMQEEADLKIKWEDTFPHAYGGPIPYACLAAPPAVLALGPDGKHVFPLLGAAAAAAAAASAASGKSGLEGGETMYEAIERGMDDEDGYDGGPFPSNHSND